MKLRDNEANIYLISGKAQHGKDTTAIYMRKYYENKGLKVINLQFSSYIKEYAKHITSWDGSEQDKPRELLQMLGTDIIRKRIDELFFIKKLIEDIKVYNFFFDVITISDVRTKNEIKYIKEVFKSVNTVRVIREDFDNGLTEEEKKHFTEIDLDSYNNYDIMVYNNFGFLELEKEIFNKLEEYDERN